MEHYDLLKEALDNMGLGHVVLQDGRLLVSLLDGQTIIIGGGVAEMDPKHQGVLNGIKRAYTRRTTEELAKNYRMTVVDDPDDPDHIVLRSYQT